MWAAANSLGCSTQVLEERYGTWDLHSQVQVVAALTRATKQKAAIRQMKAHGIYALAS